MVHTAVLGSLKASQAHRQDVLLPAGSHQPRCCSNAHVVPFYSPLRRSPPRDLDRQRSDGCSSPHFVSGACRLHIGTSVYLIGTITCTLSGRAHVPYSDEHMYPIGIDTCKIPGRTHVQYGNGHPAAFAGRGPATGKSSSSLYLQYGLTDFLKAPVQRRSKRWFLAR